MAGAILKAFLAVLTLGVLGLLLTFCFRVGAFRPVEIDVSEMGPHQILTKDHLGAYHKTVEAIEEVESWVKKHGESCQFSIGEYIDDPDSVSEDRLRSSGGCIVEKDFSLTADLPKDFRQRTLPTRLYVWAKFDGAPSIGPLKVYPKVRKFMNSNGYRLDGPVLELYEILPGDRVVTTYLFPARKN